ncbi:hypothetical protein G7Y79_00003g008990 [Physcia stellaris]|nr:hypothetical protein G7Y79_00003g008990 [Physcia stellaris]
MSFSSYDDLALSLLLALLLPNLALVEAEDDTAKSSTNPEALSSPVIHVSKIQELKPRRPVETPPTEYLPYPPPDNYQWPPGMNAGNENPQSIRIRLLQLPKLSSLLPLHPLSSSTSSPRASAPPPAASPVPPSLIPSSTRSIQPTTTDPSTPGHQAQSPQSKPHQQRPTPSFPLLAPPLPLPLLRPSAQRSHPRDPIETPPTEYLPYPPPADYVWPAGQSPGNENPQPSEFDSPGGWYGSAAGGQGGYRNPGYSSPADYGGVLSKSSHNAALSPGAIAGIAVGGAVAVVLVLFCVWRARKVRRRRQAEGGDGLPMAEPGSEAS